MNITKTTDGRPPGGPALQLPLLLGCGEPLRGRSAKDQAQRPHGGRQRPILSIQLPARLLEQRLTRQRR